VASRYTLFLKRIEIFAGLSEADCEEICRLVQAHHYCQGQVLFRQGDASHDLYLVVDGRIKVYIEHPEGDELVAHFEGGEILGEMALLTGHPRSASAVAVADSRLLVIPKEDFDAYLADNVHVLREIAKMLADRQARTNARLSAVGESGRQGPAQREQVLTIEIDELARQEEVEEIIASDFFEEIERKAKEMRARHLR
jgi:CRP-like cAMP-binding protein